jgi:hypothetical protein
MERFESVLLILLGSLLGILSPGLIDWIRRAHRRKPIKRAILLELDELRYTLASTAYRLRSHLGTLDHDLLNWLEPIETAYTGPDRHAETVPALRALIAMTPDQLQRLQQTRTGPPSGLTLKQSQAPFLNSQLMALQDFDPDFQRRLLQIRSQLELLNEEVPYLMRQFELTFGDLAPINRPIVQKNLTDGYAKMAIRAEDIANRISQLVPLSS